MIFLQMMITILYTYSVNEFIEKFFDKLFLQMIIVNDKCSPLTIKRQVNLSKRNTS